MMSSDTKPAASPCNPVNNDQNVSAKKYVQRVPTRSSITPPGICAAVYVHENAEKITPINAGLRPSSWLMLGAAMPATLRSR